MYALGPHSLRIQEPFSHTNHHSTGLLLSEAIGALTLWTGAIYEIHRLTSDTPIISSI